MDSDKEDDPYDSSKEELPRLWRGDPNIRGAVDKDGVLFTNIFIVLSNRHEAAWFEQLAYMPDWLYKYFGAGIAPIIFQKDGCNLSKPAMYTTACPSFWIHPP
jgi:hypothetical protein